MRRRNGAPMLYNAYDSNGVHHIQEKAMTMTSVATSTAGESRATSVATNSTSRPAASANRPAAGPSRPAAPAASPQPIRVITNQRTGWAKPVSLAINPNISPSLYLTYLACYELYLSNTHFRLVSVRNSLPIQVRSQTGLPHVLPPTADHATTPAMMRCEQRLEYSKLAI